MAGGDDPDWAQIKRAYDDGSRTMDEICRMFGVSKHLIAKRRCAEGWTPRPRGRRPGQPTAKTRAKARRWQRVTQRSLAAPAMGAVRDDDDAGGAGGAGGLQDLVRRLYNAIDNKLAIIEERMAMSDMTAADTERDARTIGALIRSLEKLTAFDEEAKRAGDDKDDKAGVSADEADRIRRDLKERIERMCGSEPA